MAVKPQSLANLKPLAPGCPSLNPGGKPVESRNRLTKAFLHRLADDFDLHGKKAIERCRIEQPAKYIMAIAGLLPKEIEIKRPLDGLTDDELAAIADQLRSQIGAEPHRSGTEPAPELERVN